jgi:altronate hydrolase
MCDTQDRQVDVAGPGWSGYLRNDGRKGVRNLVLVVYTVECAKHVAHAIADGEPDTHVIGFPGCYDNAYAIRLMLVGPRRGVVLHPAIGRHDEQHRQG